MYISLVDGVTLKEWLLSAVCAYVYIIYIV
jgi:hypothetical protein